MARDRSEGRTRAFSGIGPRMWGRCENGKGRVWNDVASCCQLRDLNSSLFLLLAARKFAHKVNMFVVVVHLAMPDLQFPWNFILQH